MSSSANRTSSPPPRWSKWLKYLLIVLLVLSIIVLLIWFFHPSVQPLRRRSIRQLQVYLSSFGIWTPIVVIFLMLLATAIPPLPLPNPLIELAAGLALGFVEGFIVIWISQILSSLLAFYMSRFLKYRFLRRFMKNPRWQSYQNFLRQKGATAVLISRLTMSSPFNIISYLAGLGQMSVTSFFWATAIGTVPESLLYSLIGSQLRQWRGSLWSLTLLIIVISCVGFCLSRAVMYAISRPVGKSIIEKPV